MNSRERVEKTLNYEEPDMVPVDLNGFTSTIEAEAYERLKEYLGIEKETMVTARAHADVDEELLERFEVDTRYIRPVPIKKWEDVKNKKYIVDKWGIKWYKPETSYYFDPVEHPLSDFTYQDLKDYKYPDLWNKDYESEIAHRVEELSKNTDYFLIADALSVGIFEQAWMLRGLENFMVDLLVNKDFAHKLLDIVMEQRKEYYGRFLDIVGPYVGMVMVSDDLAGQEGPLMSTELYREMIQPRHIELNDHIKSRGDFKLFHHTCGAVRDLIDDLIKEGVDVLNPIQIAAKNMESKELKEDFGEKIVFWGGGCDTQQVLQFGTPEDVYNEVKKRMFDFKPGGGFVFTQVHEIQPDTPPENIVAMYEAVKEYRKY